MIVGFVGTEIAVSEGTEFTVEVKVFSPPDFKELHLTVFIDLRTVNGTAGMR